MDVDEAHLRRAIRLAMNGRGGVEPNPMVGCVIVKDGRTIGEGYHERFGGPHAEPTALAHCTESPAGATAYVTLEPCCHTGKKTPPCAPRLIAERIARVVIGCLDPNPEVNGNGVRMLREAGIVVDGPLLEAECKQLIAAFIKQTRDQMPYVTAKWAMSADHRVAGPDGQRVQISNPRSSHLVQLLRAASDAILVGVGTVLNDDPTLLPRGVTAQRPIRRMVLDTHLRMPATAALATSTDRGPVEVYTSGSYDPSRRAALEAAGVRVVPDVPIGGDGRLDLGAWLRALGTGTWGASPTHVLVELGPTLARPLLPLADREWEIRSPKLVGDGATPSPVRSAYGRDRYVFSGKPLNVDDDVLSEGLNSRSSAYFAAVPSADFTLAGGAAWTLPPVRRDSPGTPKRVVPPRKPS